MNYTNLQECINYILLRIYMNLNKNIKHYKLFLLRNKDKTIYTINIVIYILSKKIKLKFIICKILNIDEIEIVIDSLMNKIEEHF